MCSAPTLGHHVMPGPALLTAITQKMHLLQKLRRLWPANHGRTIPAACNCTTRSIARSGHMELYNINWDLHVWTTITEFMQVATSIICMLEWNNQAFCWFIYSFQMQNKACFYECDPILGHFQPPRTEALDSVPVCASYCN